MPPFQLTAGDFDALTGEKQRQNSFNPERAALKAKLLTLEASVREKLGAKIADLSFETSVEFPCAWNQWQVDAMRLFLFRGDADRRTLLSMVDRDGQIADLVNDPAHELRNVILSLSVENHAVEIALRLSARASIDLRNFMRKVAEMWERDRFIAFVKALPADFHIGVDPTGPAIAPERLDAAGLEMLTSTLAKPVPAGAREPWLVVGRRIDRTDKSVAKIATLAVETVDALLPIYRFIAWAKGNDHAGVGKASAAGSRGIALAIGLAKNDKVTVIEGMFAGKSGLVQEIDKSGMVKVLIGNVPVKLAAKGLRKAEQVSR